MDIYEDEIEEYLVHLRDYGLEFVARRFYSMYQGEVVDNIDLCDQGRVQVRVLETGLALPLSVWAYPGAIYAGRDYGVVFTPEIGDSVWVWFHLGDPSQPRYCSGWWLNPANQKTSATSYMPAEFKTGGTSLPTVRGIKTKRGHSLLFDDTPDDPFVQISSGVQSAPGVEAIKNHNILLADEPGFERLVIDSKKGHTLFMLDQDGNEKVFLDSQGGHKFELDDTPGIIRVKLNSTLGHTLIFDDINQKITINTAAGHSIEIDDILQKIEATTLAGRKLLLDDTTQSASIETPTQKVEVLDATQTINIIGAGAVNVSAAGAANVIAGGVATVQGAGVSITSTGTAPSNYTGGGIANVKFDGKMIQDILALDVISDAIKLGDVAGAVSLMTEAFVQLFNTHTHPSDGAPPDQQAVIGTHTTTKTKAS